jgi:hypothetical protein
MLREDDSDLLSGDISLIKIGIDSHQDDVLIGFEVVNDPITAKLTGRDDRSAPVQRSVMRTSLRRMVQGEVRHLEVCVQGT